MQKPMNLVQLNVQINIGDVYLLPTAPNCIVPLDRLLNTSPGSWSHLMCKPGSSPILAVTTNKEQVEHQ